MAKAEGISQSELARKCGISRAAVSKWFSSASATMQAAHVFTVARLLRVDAEWLATGHGRAQAKSETLEPKHLSLLQDYRALPDVEQTAVRTIIVSLARLNDPSYRSWEAKQAALVKKRDGKAEKA